MQNRTVVNAPRNLPTPVVSEVERMGYGLLRGLDRMGFTHEDKSGEIFTVRFSHVALYGGVWASFTVDAERLWHFSVADLSKPPVLAQLAAVVKRPVRAETSSGLTYAIELQPKPKVRLPDKVVLDLELRPEGDLLVPIGVGRAGAMWHGLPEMGHALIVGETGSGKSSQLHSMLAGAMSGATPEQVRFALVDPKGHEFSVWKNAPHTISRAVTVEEAESLVGKLAIEANRRGDLMDAMPGVCRDLATYNAKSGKTEPYLVCVFDECLDMLGESRSLDDSLKVIAQRGRSAGVFLWLATQHSTALAGMPRVIKVNLSTRFVFRVADEDAARNAGCPGAEAIPRDRPGRMLAKVDGKPQELQGYYLPDNVLSTTAAHVAQAVTGGRVAEPVMDGGEIELLTWARDRNEGYLSIADVQRKRKVGYTEARRITEALESRGLLEKDKASSNRRRLTGKARESLSGLSEE